MRCPFCQHGDSIVRDSRVPGNSGCVKRRRECPACSKRFTTIEHVIMRNIQVIKRSGIVKPFDKDKLYRSLYIATRKCNVNDADLDSAVYDIVFELEKKQGPVSTDVIGNMAMLKLRAINKVAYIRYASVYKNFREVQDFNDFVHKEEIL